MREAAILAAALLVLGPMLDGGSGTVAAQALPPIAAPPGDDRSPVSTTGDGAASSGAAGRYGVTLVPGAAAGSTVHLPYVLLLDTATGSTWVLSPVQGGGPQTMIWTPVPFLAATGTASTVTPR